MTAEGKDSSLYESNPEKWLEDTVHGPDLCCIGTLLVLLLLSFLESVIADSLASASC